MVAIIDAQRSEIGVLCRKHRVRRLEVFGSPADRTIDRSTFCGFRKRFKKELKDLFRQIGRVGMVRGLPRRNQTALDGTRVKANRSPGRRSGSQRATRIPNGFPGGAPWAMFYRPYEPSAAKLCIRLRGEAGANEHPPAYDMRRKPMNRRLTLLSQHTTALSLLAAGLIVPTRVAAHDSWLVADKNLVAINESVRLAFVTAEVFPISDHAPKPDRVTEWVVAQGPNKRTVEGASVEGNELAARLKLDRPGIHAVGIAMQPGFIELAAKEFGEYLEDEKATAALAAHRRGPGDQPGREFYTKFAKTFVEVAGGGPPTDFTQPVGHKLEIIPLSNPCQWKVGDEVKVRVLLEGRPAPNLRVSSGHEGLGPHTYVESVITGADGMARVKLSRPGLWFLRTHTIHTIREQPAYAPRDAPKADWESFWASITFRVLDRGP
jgi:uncharacterized GH25 family protein